MPRLTQRLIDTTPTPATGQQFLRDTDVRGLAVRLTPTLKTYIVEKRFNQRLFRVVIGPCATFTVEQARKQAQAVLRELYAGHDPQQTKRQQREELTLGELWELYTERQGYLKSFDQSRRRYENHLASWSHRKLSTISRAAVAQLHAQIGAQAPYAANRFLSLLHTLYESALSWGVYAGENPVKRIKRYPEEQRERFVQPAELPRFFEALKPEPPLIQVGFQVMLLTGAREMEVFSMRWDDVDFDRATWTIPSSRSKNKKAHYVPLPSAVVELLQAMPRRLGSPYVFATSSKTGHLVNPWHAWGRIKARMGVDDLRIHDLRRTLGSWLAADGASLAIIGKALNHAQPQTTAIYARLNLDPVRTALEANAQRMLQGAC
jgi:integrase